GAWAAGRAGSAERKKEGASTGDEGGAPGRKGDDGPTQGRLTRTGALPAAPALDGEDVCVREEAADRMRAEPAHAALDGAVSGVRVDARPRIPALAVDLELRLVGVVAQQPELVKAGFEPGLTKSIGDRLGSAFRLGRAGLADADLDAQRLDQVHGR